MKRQHGEIAGNLDTGLLKIIALVCMLIDHAGARLFPGVTELRLIGRVAFPLYLWCMTVGACYTRSPRKYALRLLLLALISQPVYILALNHNWRAGNIFVTLLLGYLALWGIRENKYGSAVWAPVLCVLAPLLIPCDYGWRGVLLAILLYMCRSSRPAIAALLMAYCLFWGANSSQVTRLFGVAINNVSAPPPLNWIAAFVTGEIGRYVFRVQAFALLALPLILWPRAKRTPFPQWAAYAAYPAHLLALWVVELLLGVETLGASLARLMPWM